MKNRFLFLMISIMYNGMVYGQYQLGLKTGVHSGSLGILTDPTATSVLPYNWDATIVGASLFLENNIMYIPDMGLTSLGDSDLALAPVDETTREEGVSYIEFKEAGNKFFAVSSNQVFGPSFVLKLPNFNLGFFSGSRVIAGSTNIPTSLNVKEIRENELNESVSFEPMSISAAAYHEIGVNFSKSIDWNAGELTFGGNLKYLIPYQAYSFSLHESLDAVYETLDTTTNLRSFSLAPSSATFSYTTNENGTGTQSIGSGFGADLGVSYAVYNGENLNFRLGASLTDIGSITANKGVVSQSINLVDSITIDESDFQGAEDLDEVYSIFERTLEQEITNSTTETDNFSIGLATTFNLFGTASIAKNLYASVQYSQPLALFGKESLTRGSMLAVTPHYESKWLGLYVPISFYEFSHLRVGTAIKLGPLTVGTEDLMSILGKSELTGTDFYVALKIFPFGKNKGGKSSIDCYEF